MFIEVAQAKQRIAHLPFQCHIGKSTLAVAASAEVDAQCGNASLGKALSQIHVKAKTPHLVTSQSMADQHGRIARQAARLMENAKDLLTLVLKDHLLAKFPVLAGNM